MQTLILLLFVNESQTENVSDLKSGSCWSETFWHVYSASIRVTWKQEPDQTSNVCMLFFWSRLIWTLTGFTFYIKAELRGWLWYAGWRWVVNMSYTDQTTNVCMLFYFIQLFWSWDVQVMFHKSDIRDSTWTSWREKRRRGLRRHTHSNTHKYTQ